MAKVKYYYDTETLNYQRIEKTTLDRVKKGDTVGTIEAVKTVADIFSPVSGEVVALNLEIENNPELVNSDPYNKGWLIKMKVTALYIKPLFRWIKFIFSASNFAVVDFPEAAGPSIATIINYIFSSFKKPDNIIFFLYKV